MDPSCIVAFMPESGTTWFDYSGNGKHGTVSAATFILSGRRGYTAFFNGNDQYISTNVTFKGLTQATLEAWVLTTILDGAAHAVYMEPKDTDSNTSRFTLYIDTDNRFKFAGRAPDTDGLTTWVDSTKTLAINTWYHVVAIFNSVSDIQTLFINGAAETNAVVDAAFSNTNPKTNPRIGISWLTSEWKGFIDEFRLYNRALTTPEVSALYKHGKP
jgi:hypothetical protein